MARGPALRPLRSASFRQELRRGGATAAEIERNRVQLVRAQWELAHALIDRHVPEAA